MRHIQLECKFWVTRRDIDSETTYCIPGTQYLFLNIKIGIKRLTKKHLLKAMDKTPYLPRSNPFYEVSNYLIFLSIFEILHFREVKQYAF